VFAVNLAQSILTPEATACLEADSRSAQTAFVSYQFHVARSGGDTDLAIGRARSIEFPYASSVELVLR